MGKPVSPVRTGRVVIGDQTHNVRGAMAALMDIGTTEAAKLPGYDPAAPREMRLRNLRNLVDAGKAVAP
jgi:hypothetical protein